MNYIYIFSEYYSPRIQVANKQIQVRFCFAKFVIRHFEEVVNKGTSDIRVPMIRPLLHDHLLLGKGEPLEWLTLITLVWRINQFVRLSPTATTWASCYPFFSKSFLMNEPLPQGPIDISHLPAMTTDRRVKRSTSNNLLLLKDKPDKIWGKKAGVCFFFFLHNANVHLGLAWQLNLPLLSPSGSS